MSSIEANSAPGPETKPAAKPKRKQKFRGSNSAQMKQDAFREKTNAKVIAEFRAAQNAKFLGDVQNLVYKPPINTSLQQPTAVVKCVPVSTVGIGRAVFETYVRYTPQFNGALCSIHQLYRYTLMQFSYQLDVAWQKDNGTKWPNRIVNEGPLPSWVKSVAKSYTENFSYLCAIINSVGNFVIGDQLYQTVIEQKPSPQSVTLMTLRSVCEYYAAHEGLLPVNTIPGAAFNGQGHLANPGMIIPPNYGLDELRNDCLAVRRALDAMRAKFNKITSFVKYDGIGSPASLVCFETYHTVPGFDPPPEKEDGYTIDECGKRKSEEAPPPSAKKVKPPAPTPTTSQTKESGLLPMFAGMMTPKDPMTIPITAHTSEVDRTLPYWAPDQLDDVQFLIGSFALLGFTSNPLMAHYPQYRIRDPNNASFFAYYDWDVTFDRLTPPEARV